MNIKAKFFAALAFMVLLVAGNAEATSTNANMRYAGIWCRGHGTGITCLPTQLGGGKGGYGIGISSASVLVVNLDTGKTVFVRYQP